MRHDGTVHASPPPAIVITERAERTIAMEVRARLADHLGVAARRPEVARLLERFGAKDFYDLVATIELEDADDWHEMGRVQRQFAAAEHFFDVETRAYTEAMRLTLHATVILHLADPTQRRVSSLFEQFIELHVSAFRDHGGWFDNLQIPRSGAFAVVEATRPSMIVHLPDLIEGAFYPDALTLLAARWVREARSR